jgi:hypothetical protein
MLVTHGSGFVLRTGAPGCATDGLVIGCEATDGVQSIWQIGTFSTVDVHRPTAVPCTQVQAQIANAGSGAIVSARARMAVRMSVVLCESQILVQATR